jgi:hypothetical protein
LDAGTLKLRRFEAENGETFNLIWSRGSRQNAD